ncbi:MAG: murein biosynthesis integral membrane protein MurJ [Hyphomicrobium sp.]
MKLYRAFATVGGLTMVSRILGFVRDILIAAGLGTGSVADAYFVAFRFPNLFRRLFGEGAFNAAFVPLFAKRLEGEGPEAAKRFAEEVLSVLAIVLLVFSALAMLAMPWLMTLLAPGFVGNTEKYDLAVDLTQIAFPYLFCMSLVALLSGILNSMHDYWAAAAAPILLNVVLIAAAASAIVFGLDGGASAGYLLAAGVTLAGLAQLAMLWFAVRRMGLKLSFPRPRLTEGVRRLVKLGVPGLLAGGITQINIVVGTIIASLQPGAVSYLYYSDRLYQLPLGIIGVAVGVVLLPELARKLRAGDRPAAMDAQNRSLEFGLLLTLPAAITLAVVAEPIIRVLFERGAFKPEDTAATAAALGAIAFGLPSFVMLKVFQPAFFAREDTRTPLRYAWINMAIDVLGSFGLFFLFKAIGWRPYVGIPIATSIAGWVNAYLLWRALQRTGGFETDPRLISNLWKSAFAGLAMVAALFALGHVLDPTLASGQPAAVKIASLTALLGGAFAVYVAIVIASGVVSLAQLRRFFSRKAAAEKPPAT